MTLSPCDQVTERVALGESLGELTEHATTCSSCRRVVAVSSKLGATHHEVDPGLGFSARMTVGAQHRLAVRRRRRLAAGLAATVATGAIGAFVVTRTPDREQARPVAIKLPTPSEPEPSPKPDPATTADDADLAALVQLADVDRSSRLSATWAHIKKPLAPYKKLIKGVTP